MNKSVKVVMMVIGAFIGAVSGAVAGGEIPDKFEKFKGQVRAVSTPDLEESEE